MSEYDELLEQCKQHSMKLKEFVPKMYDALLKEGELPSEAAKKIKKDLIALGWSSSYIISLLPIEAKDKEMSEAGKQGIAEKSKLKELNETSGTAQVLQTKPSDDENPTTASQPEPDQADTPTTPNADNTPDTSFLREITKEIEEKLSQKADFTAEVLQGVIEKLSSIDMEVFSVGEQVEIIDGSKCPKCWFKLHARVRKGRKLELFKAM